jgi:hypothetical protein
MRVNIRDLFGCRNGVTPKTSSYVRIPGPPVDSAPVRLPADDLGCEILGCSAECSGGAVDLLRESEVRQLDVPVGVEQDVLWFKIAVDDALRVKIVERERDHRHVIAHRTHVKARLVPEVVEEFPAREVLEPEVELRRSLEGKAERHDERMRHLSENAALEQDGVDFLRANQTVFVDTFDCKKLFRRFVLAKHHFTE